MKHFSSISLAAASAIIMACGCKSVNTAPETATRTATDPSDSEQVMAPVTEIGIGGRNSAKNLKALNYAMVYRTNGDYDNNVPVTLSADGRALASYPAPSDVSAESSTPVKLADGWLLDRRGLSLNSVFTTYTYSRYHALKNAPSPEELLRAIIPGSGVVEAYRLPVLSSQAIANPDTCNVYIAEKFKNCTPLRRSITLR